MEVWELTGRDFESRQHSVAVIPIGSVERHGDHLPLGTDAIEAEWVARQVAERLGADLFPTIWYGVSPGLAHFPGTINVSAEAFINYVYEILREIARNGYRLIVVINGHGGNTTSIRVAMKRAAYETGASYIMFDWWRDAGKRALKELFTAPGHAGEDETSAMLYIDGAHVKMEHAKAHVKVAKAAELKEADIYAMLPGYAVESRLLDDILYPEAMLGDATKASAEKGRRWMEEVVNDIVSAIKDLQAKLGLLSREGNT